MRNIITVLLLAVLTCSAQPWTRNTKRVVNGAHVNLTPIVTWWAAAEKYQEFTNQFKNATTNRPALSPRPLPAWVRITGTPAQTPAIGWRFDASIEAFPGHVERQLIFLRHPPMQEKERFDWLVSELAKMGQVNERANSEASENRAIASNAVSQANGLYTAMSATAYPSPLARQQASALSQQAVAASARADTAMRNSRWAESRQIELAKELSAYPSRENYVIDFLALRTGETYAGLPVYDLGQFAKDFPRHRRDADQ